MNGNVGTRVARGRELFSRPKLDDLAQFSRSLEAFMRLAVTRVRSRAIIIEDPSGGLICPEPQALNSSGRPARFTVCDVVKKAAPINVKIRLSDFLPGHRLREIFSLTVMFVKLFALVCTIELICARHNVNTRLTSQLSKFRIPNSAINFN